MLSLGHFLISDHVSNLHAFTSKYNSTLLSRVFFYTKGDIITFVKLTIAATSNILILVAGSIPGKVPNTMQLICLHYLNLQT